MALGAVSVAKTVWLTLWVAALGPVAASVGWLLITAGRTLLARSKTRRALTAVRNKAKTPSSLAATVDQLSRQAGVEIEVVAVTDERPVRDGRLKHDTTHTAHWIQTGKRRGIVLLGQGFTHDNDLASAAVAHELGHGAHNHGRLKAQLRIAVDIFEIVAVAYYLNNNFWHLLAAVAVLELASRTIQAVVSRRLEYAADDFAVTLVGADNVAKLFGRFEELHYGIDRPGFADNLFGTHPFNAKRLARARAAGRTRHVTG
jgi:Zn-dependent protease with chaperone function